MKVYGGVFTSITFNDTHSKKTSNYQQSIVDIKMRASLCSDLQFQDTNRKLKYFNYLGNNNVTNMNILYLLFKHHK